MKNFTLILLLLIFSFSQETAAQLCQQATASLDLKSPRVEVRHSASGDLWWDGVSGKFVVEDATLATHPASVAFAASLWLGASDPAGNLKFAGNTYGLITGNTDWSPGPLDNTGLIDSENCLNFDRLWEVKFSDINLFEADYADNGVIDNTIPEAIQMWPGKDNPLLEGILGFELPSGRYLAPFIDRDNDGIYNPQNGDVPDTKGALVANWWIFNDNGNVHSSSGGNPMAVDVSVLSYSFDDNPFGASTVFYEYKISNQSVEPILDLHAGLWLDPDLGCSSDDYVGCLPEENLAFVYNHDVIDGNDGTSCNGVPTFDLGIPLFGIKVLEGTKNEDQEDNGMSSFIYYSIVQDNFPPPMSDPLTALEMNRLLTGFWRDGTPITEGGTGYNPSSSEVTKYAYSDAPNSASGWSMCSTLAPPGDQRIILGSGPTNLNPGESIKFSLAAIVTQKVVHPCPDVTPLVEAARFAQVLYDQLPSSLNSAVPKAEFSISPNPATEFINITTEKDLIKSIELINISGQLLRYWSDINTSNYRLDVNGLGKGMYLVKLKLEDGSLGVKRVVVQ